MAVTLQIKRSTGTSAPGSLADGELAYTHGTGTQGNLGDRLFIGDGSSVNVIGGQYFGDMLDHVAGTLTARGAIVVDSNKAIDELFIGNHSSNGGGIKFNEGTGNGSNYVALKSPAHSTFTGGSWTLTLPGIDGTDGQFLKTDGSGVTSWAAAGTITGLNTNAANILITFGSTTTELDGEANLTFDGSLLSLASSNSGAVNTFIVENTSDTSSAGSSI